MNTGQDRVSACTSGAALQPGSLPAVPDLHHTGPLGLAPNPPVLGELPQPHPAEHTLVLGTLPQPPLCPGQQRQIPSEVGGF